MNCGTERGYGAHKAANEPACAYCKAWKTKHDAGTVKVAPVRSRQQVAQCGTTSGYRKHRRHHEPACRKCLDAANNDRKAYKDKREGDREIARRGRKSDPREHGTAKGRGQHKSRGEKPCEPCRIAYNKRNAEMRAERLYGPKGIPGPKPSPCGSHRGYKQHLAKGEPTCAPCRAANAAVKAHQQAETQARDAA